MTVIGLSREARRERGDDTRHQPMKLILYLSGGCLDIVGAEGLETCGQKCFHCCTAVVVDKVCEARPRHALNMLSQRIQHRGLVSDQSPPAISGKEIGLSANWF